MTNGHLAFKAKTILDLRVLNGRSVMSHAFRFATAIRLPASGPYIAVITVHCLSPPVPS